MVRLNTSCAVKWDYESLHCKQEEGQFNFYLKNEPVDPTLEHKTAASSVKIQLVDELPFATAELQKLSKQQLKDAFDNTSLRITPLTDGSYKLSVCLKLLGGVKSIPDAIIANPEITSRQLSSIIIAHNIPAGTFSSIQVNSCSHRYGLSEEAVPSRSIRLIPGKGGWDAFKIDFVKFFCGYAPPNLNANTNAISDYVLGVEHTEEGEAAIKGAYENEMAIYIYLSTDGLDFDVVLEKGQKPCSIM